MVVMASRAVFPRVSSHAHHRNGPHFMSRACDTPSPMISDALTLFANALPIMPG